MLVRNQPEGDRWWVSECSLKYNDIHWHSFYELELVLDGCVYENINGYECTLTRGMLTLLSPYDFHKIDTRSINEVSILKIGFCEEELSEEIRQLLRNARIPFLLKLNEDMISEFRKQLHTIQEMIKSNHAYQLYVIRRYVELLLLDILGKMAADPSIIISEMETCTDTQVNSIRAVLLHIDSHYAEPIRRDEIAENLHYSPNYLSTLFRQMTGYTISDYVTKVRMTRAYEYLKTTDLPIKDIIQNTGFRSQSLFYKTFEQCFGKLPKDVRNNSVEETCT